MSYLKYNVNPCKRHTEDCTVRALSTLFDKRWEEVFLDLCMIGLSLCVMPSHKSVLNEFMRSHGYQRFIISNHYPADYSVADFTDDHPHGLFLLATDSHVVPVIDGFYIDNWDSGKEIPIYYWSKGYMDNAI